MMVMSFTKLPKGPNTVILSHAGGPGVLAADALSHAGGELATVPAEVIKDLDQSMPKHWSMVPIVHNLGNLLSLTQWILLVALRLTSTNVAWMP